jgi:uncharacterized membrane protein
MMDEGRRVFRYDTFGDEAFWGDTLKLHNAIAGAQHGGVGPGVSPKTALSVGLKVDMDAVPAAVAAGIRAGTVNLDDPANTLALLKANAVVGVTVVLLSTATVAGWVMLGSVLASSTSRRSLDRPSMQ